MTMSAGRLLLAKFPIRYPDHLTMTTPRRMRALAARRVPDRRGLHAAVPSAPVRLRTSTTSSSPRKRRTERAASAMSTDPIVILGAGPAGISAAWRLSELGRRWSCSRATAPSAAWARRSASAGMPSTTARTRSTSARPRRAAPSTRRSEPFFGPDPLILTRGTRVLLRGKEYVYPLEMMQVLTGVSPFLSARIVFDYADGDAEVGAGAAAQGALVRGVGRAQSRAHALRPVLRDLLRAGVGSADVPDLVEAGAARRQAEPEERRSCGRSGSRPIRRPTSPSTCTRARASACCSRTWRQPRAEQRALRPPRFDRSCASSATATGSRASFTGRAAREIDRLPRRAVDAAAAAAGRHDGAGAAGRRSREHAAQLRYRSLKLIYIALKRPQLTDYHWVYLLDGQFRVNRMSEQKNVSAEHGAGRSHGPVHRAVVLARRADVERERRRDLPHRARRPA